MRILHKIFRALQWDPKSGHSPSQFQPPCRPLNRIVRPQGSATSRPQRFNPLKRTIVLCISDLGNLSNLYASFGCHNVAMPFILFCTHLCAAVSMTRIHQMTFACCFFWLHYYALCCTTPLFCPVHALANHGVSRPWSNVVVVEPQLIWLPHSWNRLLEVLQNVMEEKGKICHPWHQAEQWIGLVKWCYLHQEPVKHDREGRTIRKNREFSENQKKGWSFASHFGWHCTKEQLFCMAPRLAQVESATAADRRIAVCGFLVTPQAWKRYTVNIL